MSYPQTSKQSREGKERQIPRQSALPLALPFPPVPAGMLTLDGHCKTLDRAADGYVRAETCIVLLLSAGAPPGAAAPAAAAGGQGPGAVPSSSSAILRSTFVNQDGRSSSLTAPNGPAQQAVMRGALAAAGLEPGQIMGLEMHGTGEVWQPWKGDFVHEGGLVGCTGHACCILPLSIEKHVHPCVPATPAWALAGLTTCRHRAGRPH